MSQAPPLRRRLCRCWAARLTALRLSRCNPLAGVWASPLLPHPQAPRKGPHCRTPPPPPLILRSHPPRRCRTPLLIRLSCPPSLDPPRCHRPLPALRRQMLHPPAPPAHAPPQNVPTAPPSCACQWRQHSELPITKYKANTSTVRRALVIKVTCKERRLTFWPPSSQSHHLRLALEFAASLNEAGGCSLGPRSEQQVLGLQQCLAGGRSSHPVALLPLAGHEAAREHDQTQAVTCEGVVP